jgi:homoserine kinase
MPIRLSKPSKPFSLSLPATSANLGPAFDAAALAFGLNLKLRARTAAAFSIAARGRDPEICGQIDKHLILTTYREVLQSEGKPVQPLALAIDNQIPVGKGCGSSAAARLAGIALAVHFGRLKWSDSRIIGEASQREHHPDNASACWMGGLTVAKMSKRWWRGLPPKENGRCCWRFRTIPFLPKQPAVYFLTSIPEPTPSPTFRIPCSCWRPSSKAAATY